MRDLPRSAQIYICLLAFLALGAFLAAILAVVMRPEFVLPAAVLTLLVVFSDYYRIVGYKNQTETTISTAVKVSGILLFDPTVVIVGTFLGTMLAESRVKRPLYKKLFNVSMMTTLYAVTTCVYTIVQDGSGSIVGTPRNWLALAALVISDLALNSLILSLVIALATRSSIRYIWSENQRPIIWHNLSMVLLGALIAIFWRLSPWTVLFATVPLILIHRSTQQINDLRRQTLEALMKVARMLDERDGDTHEHCEMVSQHAEEIARVMGLGQGEIDIIKRAAYMHDIGKLGMSDAILYKPGALTTEERELAKKHAAHGGDLLNQFPSFDKGASYVRHHHERWDGRGYPDGLKGDAIPLGARIICVSDSFQAMIEDRPYRKALPLSVALKEMHKNANTQFDSDVVKALFRAKGAVYPEPEKALEFSPVEPRIIRSLADKPGDSRLTEMPAVHS